MANKLELVSLGGISHYYNRNVTHLFLMIVKKFVNIFLCWQTNNFNMYKKSSQRGKMLGGMAAKNSNNKRLQPSIASIMCK